MILYSANIFFYVLIGVDRGQELHFYSAVLPLLKQYVLLFQCKDPRVHKLHDEQERLMREFLSCFIKPEYLIDSKGSNLSGPKMKLLNLKSQASYLPKPFVSFKASAILDQLGRNHPVTKTFRIKVIQAYVSCAADLQVKLPLASSTLRTLSCLDPDARGSHLILPYLQKLPDMFPFVKLSDKERADFQQETHRFLPCLSIYTSPILYV